MKKTRLILPLLISTTILSSCFLLKIGSNKDIDRTPAVVDGDYTYTKWAKDIVGQGLSSTYLQSTGTARILVIPVAFKNEGFTDVKLQRLYNSFFKDSSYTGWESVYSFYNKSSYGQLQITGDVSDPVQLDITKSEYLSKYNTYANNNLTYTDLILEKAVDAIAENDSDIDLSKYDMDGDGVLDAVWLVYSASYDASQNSLWAYTTWDINSTQSITHTSKRVGLYSWASIDFLTEKQYPNSLFFNSNSSENGDAHTYIHEVGHMLGLDDFYSYDYGNTSQKKYMYDEPAGGVSMMDFNIGDLDMFSKYLSGWIKPTIITEEYLKATGYTLTLSSTQENTTTGNQAFLIPRYKDGSVKNNKSVFDEYLLVEYYTPTNLNEADTQGYVDSATYSSKGVVVYHVNASIGKVTANRSQNLVWDKKTYDVDAIESAKNDSNLGITYAFTYIYSNTKSYSYNIIDDSSSSYYQGRLISLLPATGSKISGTITGRTYARDSALFGKGSVFGTGGVYSDFKFDDGSSPQFGFTVNTMTDSDCSITFEEF